MEDVKPDAPHINNGSSVRWAGDRGTCRHRLGWRHVVFDPLMRLMYDDDCMHFDSAVG